MQEPVLKIHILCAGMYGSSVVPAYFSNAVFADSVIDQRFSFGWNNVGYSVVAAIAKEEGCGRFEWWCLDWNRPSIEFYKKMGAMAMDEWTVYRVTGDTLDSMAAEG